MSKDALSGKTILISAFAANPHMSSETGIGWSFIKTTAEVASRHGMNVIAIMNQRSSVVIDEELLRCGLDRTVKTIGIGMPEALRFLLKPKLTRLEYLVWHFLAKKCVRSISRTTELVLAHHVTFATEMFPTPIVACARTTYKVWGPVGSAGDPAVYSVPPVTQAAKRERKLQWIRDQIVRVPMIITGRQVDMVLAQNQSVQEEFQKLRIPSEVFPNVIVKDSLTDEMDRAVAQVAEPSRGNRPLRILSVGHLVPRKRFELGLKALTSPLLSDAEYHIAGAPLPGYDDYLPEMATSMNIKERVTFLGKLDRAEILRSMANYDVLFHPSGREGASGVVGEATAVGIPVVCFSRTGASSVLDDAKIEGVQIAASNSISADDLARAILKAAALPRSRASSWNESRFRGLTEDLLSRWYRSV